MNTKRVNWHLYNKFQDFLSSISDENLRNDITNNAIITGGCIASLLTDEKVNDYDLYFTNKDTVIAVANYYVAKFLKFREEHPAPSTKVGRITFGNMGDPEVKVEDDRVRIYIKSAGLIAKDTSKDDYSYFEATTDAEGEDFVEKATEIVEEGDNVSDTPLAETDEKYFPIFFTDNAITLTGNIQIIIRFYGSSKEIHKNFDYIHCTNYWLSKDNKLNLNKEALISILTKNLKYCGSKYPVCSIIRLRKFIKRGWQINAGQILKICLQLSKMNLEDIKILEEQLIGVDTAYFSDLIERIKKEKEGGKEIDGAYIATLIDRIFG